MPAVMVLGGAVIAGCSSSSKGTGPGGGVPNALLITTQPSATVASRAVLGQAPVVQVIDSKGDPVDAANILVTVTLQGGGVLSGTATVSTDANGSATFNGLSIAGLVGARQLRFTAPGLGNQTSGNINLTAGPAAAVAANSVISQSALNGQSVSSKPSVKVTDLDGNGIAGVTVTFAVVSGGGTASGTTPATNASGVATVGDWVVGGSSGLNEMEASTAPALAGSPVVFQATGGTTISAYTITLQFLTSATPTQLQAFSLAKARWEQVVTGDLADVNVNGNNQCGATLSGTVDDVLILVDLSPIDGPGQILGAAGPCLIRTTGKLTIVGNMTFDTADLATIEANGQLQDVILHEMGHVLGFGSLWDQPAFNFVVGACGATPTYSGPLAIAAFNGSNGGPGGNIPLENFPGSPPTCPNGTRDSHWEEDVFQSEVMTGFISGTVRPLSLTSIQSLADLGYTVNPGAADAFNIGTQPTLRADGTEPPVLDLTHDRLNRPIYTYDPVTRTSTMVRDRLPQ